MLEEIAPPAMFTGSQGLALSDDEKTLFVGDFVEGVWALDLATKTKRRIPAPAMLQMTNLPIIDQSLWPAIDAETTPAFLDFKLVFRSAEEPVKYEDPTRQYRFEGFKAAAQLEALVRVP